MKQVLFHINDKGEVKKCDARFIRCKFGDHYPSEEAGLAAYEARYPSVAEPLRKRLLSPRARNLEALQLAPFTEHPREGGVTSRVASLNNDLQHLAGAMKRYEAYRLTGLDEDKKIPKFPPQAMQYLDAAYSEDRLRYLWRKRRYDEVARVLGAAYKRYYMNGVFLEEDVDFLPTNEEVFKMARHYKK